MATSLPSSAQQLQQPPSAFARVELALLPLSGDGSIFHRCLDYFGDTPTIIMSLLDGDRDDGDGAEDDGEDGATAAAGSIWTHVVSFMDAFTLGAMEMACRDAYFADGFKTAERWVEWDKMLFRDNKKVTEELLALKEALKRSPVPLVERLDARFKIIHCRLKYEAAFRWSRGGLGRHVALPGAFERDGRSRCRVLECAEEHLSKLYRADNQP